jgi:hypothetical protein
MLRRPAQRARARASRQRDPGGAAGAGRRAAAGEGQALQPVGCRMGFCDDARFTRVLTGPYPWFGGRMSPTDCVITQVGDPCSNASRQCPYRFRFATDGTASAARHLLSGAQVCTPMQAAVTSETLGGPRECRFNPRAALRIAGSKDPSALVSASARSDGDSLPPAFADGGARGLDGRGQKRPATETLLESAGLPEGRWHGAATDLAGAAADVLTVCCCRTCEQPIQCPEAGVSICAAGELVCLQS